MRRLPHQQARRVGPYGALLLFQLLGRLSEMDVKPPVTVALITVNLAIFGLPMLSPVLLPPHLRPLYHTVRGATSIGRACLNPRAVLAGQRHRLLLSSLVHSSDVHVLYNLMSFLYKGVALEAVLGSEVFFALIVFLSFTAHAIYVAVAVLAQFFGITSGLMDRCVVGFSGVLFGLKVVLNSDRRYGDRADRIFGFNIPGGSAPWSELLFIQMVSPNVSFLGHLSGILAGLIYVHVPRLISSSVRANGRRR